MGLFLFNIPQSGALDDIQYSLFIIVFIPCSNSKQTRRLEKNPAGKSIVQQLSGFPPRGTRNIRAQEGCLPIGKYHRPNNLAVISNPRVLARVLAVRPACRTDRNLLCAWFSPWGFLACLPAKAGRCASLEMTGVVPETSAISDFRAGLPLVQVFPR